MRVRWYVWTVEVIGQIGLRVTFTGVLAFTKVYSPPKSKGEMSQTRFVDTNFATGNCPS